MELDKPPQLVATDEVARRFGVSVPTVRRWVRERRIPCIRVSRRVIRFDLAAVEEAAALALGNEHR